MSRQGMSASAAVAAVGQRLRGPLERFLRIEAWSGIVLLLAAAVALIWANSPWRESYEALFHLNVTLGLGEWIVAQPVHFWVNDGLMTIFFLVVGLEIRRELHEGALSTVPLAMLPCVAAIGGVLAPALIYVALNDDPAARQGWAIPTATDIAFAIGVLAILGRRVPHALRVLLLAIAIIDDVAAILLIAFVYSTGIEWMGLAICAAGLAIVPIFHRLGVRSAVPYVIPGAILWLGMLEANLHPTLAGVVLGLMTPVRSLDRSPLDTARQALADFNDRLSRGSADANELVPPVKALGRANRELLPPVVRLEVLLHPWVAYGVMPLFALANAGVTLGGAWNEATDTVFAGVTLGLVLGKPVGIVLATLAAAKIGLCALPNGVTLRGLTVIGCLGGIGFTMSIFIANLAFSDAALLATAKLGVLAASAIATLVALALGMLLLPRLDTLATGHSARA